MSPHALGPYKTAEAFFHAHRFDDENIRREIMQCASPMTAKMTAKTYAEKRVIVPWSYEDEVLMRITVATKLICNPILHDMLLATGTNDIVEDVSGRPNESGLFWGGYLTPQGFKGENKLGKIWVELRDLLNQGQYHNKPHLETLEWYRSIVIKTITWPVKVELYGLT
jgi:predicted NAD-dependent protein-ADP-ribosyltransferase YbiA (DUF1768 family)